LLTDLSLLSLSLARGKTTSEALVRNTIERISDPGSEGSRAFLSVSAERALTEARASDARRQAGRALGPLDGIPVGIKDLFDVCGEVTTAGSDVLRGSHVASRDAGAVARLRSSGMVIIGRTHMNEFAYSAMGTNPHYTTPRAPWDRMADDGRGRAPGGSTSGGAVAVADGLVPAALGSDTGGSTRIPAAFCGITGYRPSQGRVPSDGVFPLAPSFDAVGPLARTVADICLLDTALTGEEASPAGRFKLALAAGLPFDALDAAVAEAVDRAMNRLDLASDMTFNWSEAGNALRSGQVTAVEAIVAHGLLYSRKTYYDPRVAKRMSLGEGIPATAYVAAQVRIASLRRAFDEAMTVDAVVMPTVAILPPRLAELDDEATFFDCNARALRNTLIANVLDLPTISLPLPGDVPVGLMLMGRRGADRLLLSIASHVEAALT
jgi:aspartyl-tRNA(Asn)/glutamyl-tRNA(Gln) amidotransferase subunit A